MLGRIADRRRVAGDVAVKRRVPADEQAQVGLSNVLPDERGTIRAMPLLSYIGDAEYPAFGLAVAAAYLRRPAPVDGRPAPDTVELAGRRIPVDPAGAVQINYFGPPYATMRVGV